MFMGLSVEVMMGGLGLLYTELDPLHHVNCMWGEDKLHVPGILSKKRFFFIFKNQIFNGFFFIFSMFMLQFLKVNIIFLYWFPKMGGGVLQPLQRAQHF